MVLSHDLDLGQRSGHVSQRDNSLEKKYEERTQTNVLHFNMSLLEENYFGNHVLGYSVCGRKYAN